VKIVALSDLHGYLPRNVPSADLAIFAGDICPEVRGSAQPGRHAIAGLAQIDWLRTTFAPWLEQIDAKTIVLVWGNHDYAGEMSTHDLPKMRAQILTDHGIEVDGVSIYGSPWTFMAPDVWAFDAPESQIDAYLAAAPDRVDILVTHGPPAGVLDRLVSGERVGSHAIKRAADRLDPRLHIFGHIHEGRGQQGRNYNVSVLDEHYKPYDRELVQMDL
jgi:Icc-related predicted phosphoesterase